MSHRTIWRAAFAAGGLLIIVGGWNHPRGAMVDMLAHHDWLWSHVLFTLGIAGLLAGLIAFRSTVTSPRLRQVTQWTIWATVLQTIEAVMHTWAMVDASNLAAGLPTPVLTTHLWMAIALYPVFGLAMIAFIVTAMRECAVGSVWFAWLGILGAAAHGLSAPLTLVFEIAWAPILFPMVMLLALWMVLAALVPARRNVASPATA